ncbi:hypothetical protein TWF694_005141 [Orbilia ellipsospora]|uniref:LysM domain-containing protein n=1 Tax=Orbilia ellipsospora TaxID=2528407 RepID=A0AAV9WUP7_9PEZI
MAVWSLIFVALFFGITNLHIVSAAREYGSGIYSPENIVRRGLVARQTTRQEEPDIDANCLAFIVGITGDDCWSLADAAGDTVDQIQLWNPALARDCSDVKPGWYYCAWSLDTATTTTSSPPSTTTSVHTAPTPTNAFPGVVSNCNDWYYIYPEDYQSNYCFYLVTLATSRPVAPMDKSLNSSDIILWNPGVGSDCSQAQRGYAYCICTTDFQPQPCWGQNYSPEDCPVPSSTTTTTTTSSMPITTTTTTTKTTTTTSTTTTTTGIGGVTTNYPTSPLAGQPFDCNKWYLVASSDTCSSIITKLSPLSVISAHLLAWNPTIGPNCAGLTVGTYLCISKGSADPSVTISTTTTMTTTTTTKTTTTTSGITTPTPIQSGQVANCVGWRFVQTGDTCANLVTRFASIGLTQALLLSWNPALKSDCSGLTLGYYICVQIAAVTTTTTTTTTKTTTTTTKTTTTSTIATPTPIQTGQVANCVGWRFVQTGDTCPNLVTRFASIGLTQALLIQWNPALKSDCSGLTLGYYICVQIAAVTTTTTTAPKTTTTTTTTKTTTTAPKTTTTTTTTKTTTTATHPKYKPSQFPATKTLQCISSSASDPTPVQFYAGDGLYSAISTACASIVGTGSLFLETGLPYIGHGNDDGANLEIDLQIRLGGTTISNTQCYNQLLLVLQGCRSGNPSRTFGGCSFTSDYNLEACIFPPQ